MEACNACHVHVEGSEGFCPLCGTDLVAGGAPTRPVVRNLYPDLSQRAAQYNLTLRLLLFVSLLGCGVSVLVNLLAMPGFWWCLIVLAFVAYCWLAIPPLLRKGVNFAKQTVFLVALTALLVVALDAIIGWHGWSVDFVLPGLLSAGILAILAMVVFNRTNWAQYALYQVIMGVFGFIPLLLYLLNIANNLVMVLVAAGLALASLLITVLFADRTVKSEFKRRFHL